MTARHLTLAAAALTATMLSPLAAGAAPQSVYVFGDSLSDTGNLAETLFGANFLNPPSFHDSFTNGPVANELLAESRGTRADPSLWATGFADVHNLFGAGFVPGTNYAVAGATATDRGANFFNLDLPEQVSAFIAHTGGAGHAPGGALYSMLIGGNDVRTAAKAGTTAFVLAGVSSELTQIQNLITDGAKQLVVTNVPDVSLIPEFTSDKSAAGLAADAAAHADSLLYDANLLTGVNALKAANPGVSIAYFDLFAYNNNFLANAGSLGFTNTTDACYTNSITSFVPPTDSAGCGVIGPNGAANIDQYIYWDAIHPTARAQAIVAQGLIAAVPEPMSVALLGVGMLGLAAVRRRRQ